MMRRSFPRLAVAAAAAAMWAFAATLLASAPALAGEPVQLMSQPTSHGGSITLKDLFDGELGQAGNVVVARAAAAAGLQAVLQADRVQSVARMVGLDWDNPQGLHRIIVTSDGAAPSQSAALGERHGRLGAAGSTHRRSRQALVYARNLMAGEVLSASDLVWSDEAVAAADTPSDPDLAIGKAARRPLREGAAVEIHDLASPIAVRRNDIVNVAFESAGITLTLEAKALGDGAVGDALQVMNPQSKKVIEAVVSGAGRAVVGPTAETLREAATSPAFRTAALP